MDAFINHYHVLGLPSGEEGFKLSQKEIKKAYRSKALELHPDKRPDDPNAVIQFQKLQESYEILKDETTRRVFNNELKNRKPLQKVEQKQSSDYKVEQKQSDDDNVDEKSRRMWSNSKEKMPWRSMFDPEEKNTLKRMDDREERNRTRMRSVMEQRKRKGMKCDRGKSKLMKVDAFNIIFSLRNVP